MAATKIIEFTVEGIGEFPVDMLRYDACYPSATEDALAIARCYHERDRSKRSVNLVSICPSWAIPHVTNDRWSSFGWTVTRVSIR